MARPPTLTVFIRNDAIDFKNREVPIGIDVGTTMTDSYRNAHSDDPLVKATDSFIAEHKNRQDAVQNREK